MSLSNSNLSKRKKIIIIGGGVAGLSAGIYGQLNGFETVIYEKNPWIGGSCSAWKRKGFVIDNCLHWLTGTKENTPTQKMWMELGVLKKDVPLVKREIFLASRVENQTATLWRDLEKSRNELIALSPEDEDEINGFLDCVKFIGGLLNSDLTPKEMIKSIKNQNFSEKPFEFARHFINYLNMDSFQLSKKFKNPAIQSLFLDFMDKNYESYWLMMAYSFFVDGNGDLPYEGSLGMVKNLKEKYLGLGGLIKINSPVKKIVIDRKRKIEKIIGEEIKVLKKKFVKNGGEKIKSNIAYQKIICKHATGVLFQNGQMETADYIISACDINYTYQTLLNNEYTPPKLKMILKNHGKGKPVIYSSFQVAFAVDGLFEGVPDTLGIDCPMIRIGTQLCSRFTIKNYRIYGDYIAPENKTVIQVSIPQYPKDYKYWKGLYPDNYKKIKLDTAEVIKKEIENAFPDYRFKLTVLDVWTPYSYQKRNNDYFGAYMRYITTPFNFNAFFSLDVRKLDNVFLASHYLRYPGGVPTAAQTGHDAIEEIMKNDF